MNNVFITGVYGTGKSTISQLVSLSTEIPFFNASDLIKKHINEDYTHTKHVGNINWNQQLLIDEVQDVMIENKRIILTGHLCLFDKQGNPDLISIEVLNRLGVSKIVLLAGSAALIYERMLGRDKTRYSKIQIEKLQECELSQFELLKNTTSIVSLKIDILNPTSVIVSSINDFIGGSCSK